MDSLTEENELTVFYKDDSNQIQGPFKASIVLDWYLKGYFSDHHLIRLTDNGMRAGQKLTLERTLAELKNMYGESAPIPLTVQSANFKGFSVAPSTRKRAFNVFKPFKNNRDDDSEWEDSNLVRSEGKCSSHKESTKEKLSSSSDASLKIKTDSPPESLLDSTLFNGPLAPSKKTRSYKKKRGRSVSSVHISENSTHKKEQEKKGKQNLPFYDDSKNLDHTRLRTKIAFEFAAILRDEYNRLEKDARNKLRIAFAKYEIPEKCHRCDCDLSHVPNYLSHVLSITHIKKSLNEDIRFTLEDDYFVLKNMFKSASEKSPVREVENRHSDRAEPYHLREKCTQS